MLRNSKIATVLFTVFVCTLVSQAARWRNGPENVVEPKNWGVTEKLVIGDGEAQTWFWNSGWGITFLPDQNMPDDQTSKELWVRKTAGGKCHWGLAFSFAKPISRFRFTTPKCSNIDLGGGDVYLQYTTDVDAIPKEIWRYGTKSPGYQKSGEIQPKELAWVDLAKPVRKLVLNFVLEGFVGNMQFFDGVNDGGVLEYFVPTLPVEQMTQITLIPDRSKDAYVYTTNDAIRAVIDIGPSALAESPVLEAVDLGRNKTLSFAASAFGDGYLADLATLPTGIYQLQVALKTPAGKKIAPGKRIMRIHAARVLTRAQELKSPFGIVAIDRMPTVAKLTGIRRQRGGSSTWCLANPSKDVYLLDWDVKKQIEDDLQYGFVRHHSLAFSPAWVVDPKQVKPG